MEIVINVFNDLNDTHCLMILRVVLNKYIRG